jgi:SAM-dependent methyltransferase
MAAIGQAQANAAHIQRLAEDCPPGARLLVAGAGTGQMFDYLPPDCLDGLRVIYSDISFGLLGRLRQRRPGAACVVDDLERSSLRGPFDAACAVLVLEHIDWRRGLAELAALAPKRLLVVVQMNPPEMTTAVTPTRVLPGTLGQLANVHPHLVDAVEAASELAALGYDLLVRDPRPVADGKTMLGLTFAKR